MSQYFVDARYVLADKHAATSSLVAHDTLTGTDVRLIAPRLCPQFSQSTTDLTSTFLLHASLRHPNLFSALEFGTCPEFGHYYTASGHSKDSLDSHRFNNQQLRNIFLQLVDALDYLYSRGIAYITLSLTDISVTTTDLLTPCFTSALFYVGTRDDAYPAQQPETSHVLATMISRNLRSLATMISTHLAQNNPPTDDQQLAFRRVVTELCTSTSCWTPSQVLEALPDISKNTFSQEHFRTHLSAVVASQDLPNKIWNVATSADTHALSTTPRLCLVLGDKGLGKTHLLVGTVHSLQVAGYRTLTIPIGAQYFDLYDLLSRYLDDKRTDPHAPVSPLEEAPAWLSHYLPYLTSGTLTHSGHDNDRIRALHHLVEALLTSPRCPRFILLDDLHQADSDSLALLRLLLARPNSPFVIATVSTERPLTPHVRQFIDWIAVRDSHRIVHLSPLDALQVRDAVRAYVCDTASVEAIGNKLFELTKGNPFLLTEALNQLAFQLRPTKRVRGGFALMIDDSHLPVETTFTSLARSALSTLSARSRELLRLMSIDPDPLDSRLLSRYSGDSRIDITATLSELHDKGIVQAVETTFATAYAIRHEYLRHHVYSSISAVSRRRLHLDLATLLESFPPLHQDARLDKIAFHHLAAMDRTHGPQLAMQAAKRAMSQFATSKAIEWLTQALLIMPSDQNDLRFEVLETLGALHWLTGDLAKSQEAYQEMLLVSRLTNRPSKEALAIRELAWVLAEVGDLPRSLSYAKLAESAYDALDDLKGATRAVLIQAQSLRKKGDLAEASHLCRRALASAERTTDVYCQSLGLVLEGLIENDLGNQDTALRHLLAAKSLKEQINDVAGLVIVLNNIGLVYLEQGRVQQAEPYFRSCLDEAKSKGLSLACTLSSINLGEACLHTGQLSTAAQLLNEAHALAQASSRRQFAAYSLLVLGIVNTVNGCYEQAVAHLTNSERDLADSGAHSDRCLALLALADLYSKLGLKDQSRRVMFEAEVLARRVESLRVRTTFACLQSTLAETHLLPLIAEARAGGRILDLVDLLLRQAQVRGFHPNADVQSLLSEAYSLAHANKLRIAEGRILLSKGICLYSHSPEEASECFRLASDLFRSFGARSLLLEALYQCARLAERDHQRKASFALEEASSLFGELASEIADENTRASYLGTYEALQSTLLANRSHTGCAIQSFSDTSLSNGERTEGGDSYSSATPLPTLITTLLDQAIQTIGAESGHLLVSSGTELRVLVTRNARGALGIDSQSSVDRFAMHVLDRSVVNSDRSEMTCPLRLGGRVRGAVHFKAWANGLPFQDSDMESVRAQIDQIERSIVAAQRHSIQVIVSTRTTSPVFSRHSLLGESPAMQKLFKMMDAVIKADCNVLLVGESGTGKELVARSIHFGGRRKTGEFVPLDCGAIPENLVESELFGHRRGAFSGADTDKKGLLEEADGGTLFLDEVTNTSLSFQAKLLRALQSGEFRRLGENAVRRVDARIIAATNMDIESVIKDGRFREDLYYRLNVVTLRLPPLRERQSDIPMLAEYFARRFCEERGMAYKGIGRGALLRLQAYAWPGNVRELEHAVHAALVVSGDGMVRRDALPERILGDSLDEVRDLLEVATLSVGSHAGAVEHDLAVGSTTSTPRDDEKARIEDALRQAGGDKSAAARILGWTAMNTQKTPPARDRVLQFLRDEGSWKKCG